MDLANYSNSHHNNSMNLVLDFNENRKQKQKQQVQKQKVGYWLGALSEPIAVQLCRLATLAAPVELTAQLKIFLSNTHFTVVLLQFAACSEEKIQPALVQCTLKSKS